MTNKPSSSKYTGPTFPKHTRIDGKTLRWHISLSEASETSELERNLRERIKELNCLYGIAQLAEYYPESLEDFLQNVVSLLPPSWQFPEITCARILLKGRTYKSSGFKVSKWRQGSQIIMHNEAVGEVEVFYLEERPAMDEGPFLSEERTLLDAVAEHIAVVAKRIEVEQELLETNRQLTVERQALQEANTALRTVLARIEDQKRDLHKDIQANVEKVLMPILYALSMEVPNSQKKYVELLRDNLWEITSPFVSQLAQKHQSLTSTEIGICNMLKSGLRTKEIAKIRNVSPATISRHRERIRQKLGVSGRNVNLTTHLQTIM